MSSRKLFYCRRGKQLKAVFGFATNPLVVFVLCKSLFLGLDENILENTLETANRLFRSHMLLDSFLYPFIVVLLVPLWNIFMHIATAE